MKRRHVQLFLVLSTDARQNRARQTFPPKIEFDLMCRRGAIETHLMLRHTLSAAFQESVVACYYALLLHLLLKRLPSIQ